jgi:hypothetical protein
MTMIHSMMRYESKHITEKVSICRHIPYFSSVREMQECSVHIIIIIIVVVVVKESQNLMLAIKNMIFSLHEMFQNTLFSNIG